MLDLGTIFVGVCCNMISQVGGHLFGLTNQANKPVAV